VGQVIALLAARVVVQHEPAVAAVGFVHGALGDHAVHVQAVGAIEQHRPAELLADILRGQRDVGLEDDGAVLPGALLHGV
jgi:hypothetical protein